MRRSTVLATALVALLAGVAGCGGGDDDDAEATPPTVSAPATTSGAGGDAEVSATVAEVKADLAAFTASMRKAPFGHETERLAALESRLGNLSAHIDALEAAAGSPGAPSERSVGVLREAEGRLAEYLRHGAEADEVAMQMDVYGYLWTLNRLPWELNEF